MSLAETSRIIKSASSVSFENRYRCKDGSYRSFVWNAKSFPDQRLIYAVGRDITGRKHAEAALQHEQQERSTQERNEELARNNAIMLGEIGRCRQMEKSLLETQEKYRSIFENAVEGIFQSTPDGTYISVNPALARIKGYDSPAELIVAVGDIGRQSYVDAQRRLEFKSQLEEHGVVNGFEYEVFRKDGKRVWLSTNARAVRDSHGSVIYYEGTVEDITQRKRLEEQLRLVHKMEAVGQLAGGIAHDFNNLLGVILGHGELLLEKLDETSPLRNHAEQINRASTSGSALIAQLLAFSRQQVLQPVVLDLNTVVRNVTKMLGSVIGENIAITTSLDPELGLYQGRRRADGTSSGEFAGECQGRNAGRWDVEDRNGQCSRARYFLIVRFGTCRPSCLTDRERHRNWHGQRDSIAHFRTLLHHQSARQRHRARPRDRVWSGQAERRLHLRLQ